MKPINELTILINIDANMVDSFYWDDGERYIAGYYKQNGKYYLQGDLIESDQVDQYGCDCWYSFMETAEHLFQSSGGYTDLKLLIYHAKMTLVELFV
jgi:hypothetical protein